MIYTVTLNPAVDYYITMDKFVEGGLNSVDDGYTLAGGKGINVSKVLENCDMESVVLGFAGGFTGDYIRKDLRSHKIVDRLVELEENTRINIKLKTEKIETEIAGRPPKISEEVYAKFVEEIKKIKKGDTLVLSGSVPKSLKPTVYADIIENLPEGVKVVLDTRGEPFKYALEKGVFLVKPNQVELEEFFGEKYENIEDLIEAGKKLRDLGSENVIISRGKDGSILITGDEVYIGNVPKGKLVSSVGAGDSMVAGTLFGLARGRIMRDAYRYGICAGSATAFKTGLANLNEIENLLHEVEIIKK